GGGERGGERRGEASDRRGDRRRARGGVAREGDVGPGVRARRGRRLRGVERSGREANRARKNDGRCRGRTAVGDEGRSMQVSGGSMSKVRVYEVAKQLNLDPKAVVALFQQVGVSDVRNHMSSVDPDQVERVK